MLTGNSAARLATCHPDLVRLFTALAEEHDLKIVWGARSQAQEEQAVANGASRVKPGRLSKHQLRPAEAVDFDLAPFDYTAPKEAYVRFAEDVILPKARELGLNLRWGGAWTGRRNTAEYLLAGGLDDVGHVERATRPDFRWEVAA